MKKEKERNTRGKQRKNYMRKARHLSETDEMRQRKRQREREEEERDREKR